MAANEGDGQMTIPPLSSSEDESARSQPSDRRADALSVGLDVERAATLAADLRSPSIDQTGRWHTKDAVYATKPRALLDAAADALLALSDPSTAWRGIESAPRDGTRILLWCSDLYGEPVWDEKAGRRLPTPMGTVFGRVSVYADLPPKAYGEGLNGDWTFTHWMPLPGAPS